MTGGEPTGSLVVLAADYDIEEVVRSVLARHKSLEISPIVPPPVIYRHPERDPGCFWKGHEFLRSQSNRFRHALVVFDCHGCGREHRAPREELEAELELRLSRNGWGAGAVAVAIDPELENWVWSNAPEVDEALGWSGRSPDLRTWLAQQGHPFSSEGKPSEPKEAYRKVLRTVRKPLSSSILATLARRVDFRFCTDPAFNKLREVLRRWFPARGEGP